MNWARFYRHLRKTIVSILFLGIAYSRSTTMNDLHNSSLSGTDLIAVIALGDDMYKKDLRSGFHYELLEKFAEDNQSNIQIHIALDEENYLDSLLQKKVDIVVVPEDSLLRGIRFSNNIEDFGMWAVRSDNVSDIKIVNKWLKVTSEEEKFQEKYNLFNSAYNPIFKVENNIKTNRLSPYDALIKEGAIKLGWDWQLLAAVIYYESRFSISSHSHKGATGIMQIMPYTTERPITELYNPEINISVGVDHLLKIQKIFRQFNLTTEELIKFTLAGYNAGPGRILDCIRYGNAHNHPNSTWADIKNIIPLLNEEGIENEESVQLGRFKGDETLKYVDNVWEIYSHMLEITNSI